MRTILVIAGCLAFASASQAAFLDNFDSYADQAAFNASWTGTSQMTLTSDRFVSSPNSIYQGTAAQQSYKNIAADSVALRDMDFSFDFYDETGTGSLARTYGMVYSRGTNPTDPWTATLNQIVAVGKYNGIATTKYSARIAFGSLNWFNLDDGPDRSVGWHTARVKGDGAVAPTLTFSIDGITGKTVALTQAQGDALINYVVMGSGLTSTHGMNYDNVGVVPDPATLLFLGLGSLLFARRRRA